MNPLKLSALIAFSLFIATSSQAVAGTLKADAAGCLTKSALNELTRAANKNDLRQIEALIGRTCFIIGGREFSVVDAGFITSTIRVYADGGSVVLWVPAEFALSAPESGGEVSQSDYGDDWPLTVDSGRVDCISPNAAVFIHNGTTYQLNGAARQHGYAPINPIWRDNPDIPGTKISIGALTDAALAQC